MTKTVKKDHPGFEKALADLEAVVAKLEKGDLPLNESLELFEKGVHLARFLREELSRAEKKVEILLKDKSGGIKTEPFHLEDEDREGEEKEEEDPSGGEGELPF